MVTRYFDATYPANKRRTDMAAASAHKPADGIAFGRRADAAASSAASADGPDSSVAAGSAAGSASASQADSVLSAASNGTLLPGSWTAYLVKAFVLVAALYVFSKAVPTMPVWCVALVWACLSMLPAIAWAYHRVVSKTFNQKRFTADGAIARVYRGRTLSLVIGFVVSAILTAGILLECPKWQMPMWVLAVLAVPGYLGISMLVGRFFNRETIPLLRDSYTAIVSSVVLCIVLCLAYLVVMQMQPAVEFERAADAFLAEPKPYENSPSTILSESGEALATIDGLKTYALSKTAQGSYGIHILLHMLLYLGTFLGLSSLLSACSIRALELKRAFTPLDRGDGVASQPVLKHCVALSVLLPVVLVAGFVVADGKAADIAATREYTFAQEFARNQVSFLVYTLDGKHYDPQKVDEILAKGEQEALQIEAEQKERLIKLVNESFDKRIANVDGYLDWLYRPFGDWETLFQELRGKIVELTTGEVNDFISDQFDQQINQGIDDTLIANELEKSGVKAAELREQLKSELDNYELTKEYPDWLVMEAKGPESFDAKLDLTLKPIEQISHAKERLGISAGAGIVGGFIAKKLLAKMGQKTIFKGIAERAASAGITRVIRGLLPFLPGGKVASIIIFVGSDLAIQKADEAINRESLKQEIMESIEEQRAETLAVIEGKSADSAVDETQDAAQTESSRAASSVDGGMEAEAQSAA